VLVTRPLLATWSGMGRRSSTSSVCTEPVFWQLERWRRPRRGRPPLQSSLLVLTLSLTLRLLWPTFGLTSNSTVSLCALHLPGYFPPALFRWRRLRPWWPLAPGNRTHLPSGPSEPLKLPVPTLDVAWCLQIVAREPRRFALEFACLRNCRSNQWLGTRKLRSGKLRLRDSVLSVARPTLWVTVGGVAALLSDPGSQEAHKDCQQRLQ